VQRRTSAAASCIIISRKYDQVLAGLGDSDSRVYIVVAVAIRFYSAAALSRAAHFDSHPHQDLDREYMSNSSALAVAAGIPYRPNNTKPE
jgi:hypothetical protein